MPSADPDDTGPDAVTPASDSGDGGDVARDPDVIQREIEQTRAELADTIDAIADRLSPKRAASRGAQAVKSQVSSVLGGGSDGDGSDGPAPKAVLDASPAQAASAGASLPSGGTASGVRRVAIEGGGTQYTGTSRFTVSRKLRVDRVLLAVGVTAAMAAVVVLRRGRR